MLLLDALVLTWMYVLLALQGLDTTTQTELGFLTAEVLERVAPMLQSALELLVPLYPALQDCQFALLSRVRHYKPDGRSLARTLNDRVLPFRL